MTVIRAAGGVLWREGSGGVEICLVHRPRYDDWSLPKGKLDPGEHPLVAAVREVHEETAVLAVPELRLPSLRYEISSGETKTVDYWSMREVRPAATSGFTPNAEIDELAWLAVDRAAELLSYPPDSTVVGAFAAFEPVTASMLLLGPRADPGLDAITGAVRLADDAALAESLAVLPGGLSPVPAKGWLLAFHRDQLVGADPIE